MESATQTAPISKKMLWAGRITSAVPVLMLLFSGVMKLVKPAVLVEEFARLGYAESLALGIGLLELVCTIVYVIPRTSVLGAILLTAILAAQPLPMCASAIHPSPSRLFSACWSGQGFYCAIAGCGHFFLCEASCASSG